MKRGQLCCHVFDVQASWAGASTSLEENNVRCHRSALKAHLRWSLWHGHGDQLSLASGSHHPCPCLSTLAASNGKDVQINIPHSHTLSQPLLENLLADFRASLPEVEFPELPKRGDLDLEEVRKAEYFFS